MVCCGILRDGSAVIGNPANRRGGVGRIITDTCRKTEISAVVAGPPQADVEVHEAKPKDTPPPHLNHIISVRLYG
jgi:hypothetical protein